MVGVFKKDERMTQLALLLCADGYPARLIDQSCPLDEFDALVLPIGFDFSQIQTRCTGKKIIAPFDCSGGINYLENNFFKTHNGILTARATLIFLQQNFGSRLPFKSVAVVGSGKIAKPLLRLFEINEIKARCYSRKIGSPLSELALFDGDLIINTIPAPVLTQKTLSCLTQKPLIIDLASRPGGVDFAAAQSLGINTHHLLSLPAKYFPQDAANLLKYTVIYALEV